MFHFLTDTNLSAVSKAGERCRRQLFRLLCWVVVLSVGCGDRDFALPDPEICEEPENATLADLRYWMAPGTGTSYGCVPITTDAVVGGVVTAVNRSGNLYGSLCIEAEGAAVVLRTDVSHLYNNYPEGSRVVLHLQGLALGRFDGMIEVGLPIAPGAYHPVGALTTPAALGAVLHRRDETTVPVIPTTVRISELTDTQCGTLVRIDDLHHLGATSNEVRWADEPTFADATGYEVRVRVYSSADFADQYVPIDHTCSLTGILSREGSSGTFQLRLRDAYDVRY